MVALISAKETDPMAHLGKMNEYAQNFANQNRDIIEKKEVNYKATQSNIAYILNRGTKKFIGKQSWQVLRAYDSKVIAPLYFSVLTGYTDSIGTYTLIALADSKESINMGQAYSWDDHYGTMRMDVYGGLSKSNIGLYHTTTAANRMAITPTYYKDGNGFKVKVSKYCLGIDSEDYLVKQECVDDSSGTPTPENERQLFQFCDTSDAEECLRNTEGPK
ncbi:hypothetical protein NEFER03_2030 [Nematocida sp. LUAm3]|nr:hypothetical protein NEFER03_2030 [Nematocida sp. LUAm3]KAI5174504.1 hypothetical protein NEFER02_0625 [Nematocida sp. LUAm2]KAI5179155.1 hypothetical protein NEFER01_2018 [Nematocida sp. LUAm1]